jgi:hypothetical protein
MYHKARILLFSACFWGSRALEDTPTSRSYVFQRSHQAFEATAIWRFTLRVTKLPQPVRSVNEATLTAYQSIPRLFLSCPPQSLSKGEVARW